MATTAFNNWSTPDDTGYVKDGASNIRTLGSAIDTSVGTGLLAWKTNFAPVMTGWTGAGTWQTAWVQIGKTVHFQAKFSPTSTTGIGAASISLPVAAKVSAAQSFTAHMVAGGTNFVGGGRITSTTTISVYAWNSSTTYLTPASFAAAVPTNWVASGDFFTFNFTYEAA